MRGAQRRRAIRSARARLGKKHRGVLNLAALDGTLSDGED
jgi:hypothetical protein